MKKQQENYIINEYPLDSLGFHLFCISETFRTYGVDKKFSVYEIFDLIPYGVIKKSIQNESYWPVLCWSMNYVGYEYNEEENIFIKK